jgi:hypothetical protein
MPLSPLGYTFFNTFFTAGAGLANPPTEGARRRAGRVPRDDYPAPTIDGHPIYTGRRETFRLHPPYPYETIRK